jgi:hypothetical protein
VGVPAIPGLSCSSAAAALGASGLGPVCQSVAGSVAGPVTSLPSQVAGFGADSVLNAAASWVTGGATWLLGQIGGALQSSTQIDLGASWFTTHFETMAALAGVVIVPLLLLGIVQAIHRQSTSMLLRSILINVPVALLLTGAAVKLVQLGLALVDAMSADVAHGAGLDAGHFLSATTSALSGPLAGAPATPAFVLFLGGLAVVFGSFLLWIELLVRAAAVYVAVLFLPLALASLAWPAVAHWCRRLVDTLVGLVLSKFVIVTVLSLAVSALAGGTNGQGSGGGFSSVLGGAALLFLAAAAPWALFRLLPFAEAAAISHLEGVGRRSVQSVSGPTKGLAHSALRSAGNSGSVVALAGGQAGKAGQVSGMATAGAAAAGVGGRSGSGALSQSVSASPVVGEESEPGSSVTDRPGHGPASDAFERTMAGD